MSAAHLPLGPFVLFVSFRKNHPKSRERGMPPDSVTLCSIL